jgi:hypothetical protein
MQAHALHSFSDDLLRGRARSFRFPVEPYSILDVERAVENDLRSFCFHESIIVQSAKSFYGRRYARDVST